MPTKQIPDAVVTELPNGAISYEQNLFGWAKNSGQAVYSESLSVGEFGKPLVTVSTETGHMTSRDPVLVAKVKEILLRVNDDGVVDDMERAAVNAVMHDILDDGELNASVPDVVEHVILEGIVGDYADDKLLNGSVPNVLVKPKE